MSEFIFIIQFSPKTQLRT